MAASLHGLFSAGPRTRTRPSPYAEPPFRSLDVAAGAEWDAIRAQMDAWHARLPAHAREEIRTRFTSDDVGEHLSAYWELYLHEAALRLGFEVDIDVGRDDGGRRPDLLISRGGSRAYVEATVVLGDDVRDRVQEQNANVLYDAINHLDIPDFLLDVYILECGARTPGRGDLTELEAWLRALDADDLLDACRNGAPQPEATLDLGGWIVACAAFPLEPDARTAADHRLIGSSGGAAGELDDITPLRRKLKKKARHYGRLDAPFVIATLCAGTFAHEYDIESALLGSVVYEYDIGPSPNVRRCRKRNGLWTGPRGPCNTRVSAVLTARRLSPFATGAVEPTLWHNPWAASPLTLELPWRSLGCNADWEMVEHPSTMTAAQVFGLPARWPAAAAA